MFISFLNVLNSIYASSALTTLSPLRTAPLLQPDHEKALRQVITDSLYLLLPRFPDSIRLLRATDNGFEFNVPANTDPTALAGTIEAMLARATLTAVGDAAGISQHLIDTLINTLPITPTNVLIAPYL